MVRYCLGALLIVNFCLAAEDGAKIYQEHCGQCHASGALRIPTKTDLQRHTSAGILRTLETGAMKTQAASLTPEQRNAVAQWLGANAPVALDASRLANTCKGTPNGKKSSSWTTWGGGLENWRFANQEAAGLSAPDVPKLKLKWAFGVPNATDMRSQSAVYNGRVFFAADTNLYSLDAATGCTYWATELPAPIRSGISVGTVGGKTAVFLGDFSGQVQAIDANSGASLWNVHLDPHFATMATATPVFHQDRLYVATASFEVVVVAAPNYVCCTFRGSVMALDAVSGKTLWKTYTIDQPAQPGPALKSGAKSMGPSGAAVWSSPTIDSKAGVLYVTTGDNYSQPASATSDAVLALSLETGKILWTKQMFAGDAYNVTCGAPGKVNCPDSPGPDYDFGAPAILTDLKNGQRLLVLAQKSGAVYALDPDKHGTLVWQSQVGKGGPLGGIEWGVSFDGNRVYTALADMVFTAPQMPGQAFGMDPIKGGGLFALKIENGERLWMTPAPPCDKNRQPCSPAQSAAVSAIPGAVFSGSLDGHIRAFSTADGKIIWDYDTEHDYQTVNGVTAKGGSLNAGGPVVAGGVVLINSGYGQFGEAPGNVLLAFAVDGR